LNDFIAVDLADTFRLQVTAERLGNLQELVLAKACVNIHHGRTSDLKISLVNPSGESIWLSNRNGGEDGRNYSETCFAQVGFFGYIHQGKNPFPGEYSPDGRFEILSENRDQLAGEWLLIIQDLRPDISGYLGSWNLHFGEQTYQSPDRCDPEHPENCSTPACGDSLLLPDLVMLPSFTKDQFVEYPPDHPSFPAQIKFAATIANIGWGPMDTRGNDKWYCGEQEVDGYFERCSDGSYPRQKILQRVYYKSEQHISFLDTVAGTNYFDSKPGHNHFHVDDWVEYKLLRIDEFGEEIEICQGEKVSYCLFDSGNCGVDDPLCKIGEQTYGPQNLANYGFGRYVDCHSGVQGISVGGYDTYGSMYEGQSLTLPPGTPNGKYLLRITVDPQNIYWEANEKNNVLTLEVDINKQ